MSVKIVVLYCEETNYDKFVKKYGATALGIRQITRILVRGEYQAANQTLRVKPTELFRYNREQRGGATQAARGTTRD